MSSVEELVELLSPPDKKEGRTHRPPWTWHTLDADERATLAELVNNWVETYNRTLATSVRELVPPCWHQHEGLAAELPVMLWHWYEVHRGQATRVGAAAEFYTRHLPGFRGRVAGYLGEAAEDCRTGRHPSDWRQAIDSLIAAWPQSTPGDEVDLLAELHCGFGPAT